MIRVILNSQFFTHAEIIVEAVVIDIHEAKPSVDGGHLQPFQQVPLRSAEIVGAAVEDDAVGNEIKRIIAAADTLVARLQQVFYVD